MIFAQSLSEYGASAGLLDRIAVLFQSGAQWVQASFQEHSSLWVTAGVGAILLLWLFRAR